MYAGLYGRVKFLLKLDEINFIIPTTAVIIRSGYPPAFVCAALGNVEFLNKFQQLGVDLNAPLPGGELKGWTLAFFAARAGRIGVLKFLRKCGIDLSVQITDGQHKGATLATIAAQNGHFDVLKYLHKCKILKLISTPQ